MTRQVSCFLLASASFTMTTPKGLGDKRMPIEDRFNAFPVCVGCIYEPECYGAKAIFSYCPFNAQFIKKTGDA